MGISMDKHQLFKIGDIARLFHTGIGSLRHYENAGLLKPEYTDPDTGYRYYGPRQFEVLNTIRYLRALDMPLEEIRDFLSNRELDKISEKLLRQKAAVEARIAELERINQKIDNNLRRLKDAESSTLDTVKELTLPVMRIAKISEPLRLTGSLDLENPIRKLEQSQHEALIFLGKVGVGISKEHLIERKYDSYDEVFLILDDEDRFDGRVFKFSQTPCVSIRFCGSHAEAAAQYAKLDSYMCEHGLQPSGFSREITMIDYGFTNDTSKFVTEISIPFEKITE